MSASQLHTLSLTEIKKLLANKEVSATDVVSASITQIKNTQTLNTLITKNIENALETAKQLDAGGYSSNKPLWGIPVTIKDSIHVKGLPTTGASPMLDNFVATSNAFAVQKLIEAGAIIIAKNNLDSFNNGTNSQTSCFGATQNPANKELTAGGSSGGSAASVAAFQAYASLATDAEGSIRQPAAFCGCVGLKPTYGRVSRSGIISSVSSMEQVGPLARTVQDVACILECIADHDAADSTSATIPAEKYAENLTQKDLKNCTIGVLTELVKKNLDPTIATAYEATLTTMQELGATLVELSIPSFNYAAEAHFILSCAEIYSNCAKFDGIRFGARAKNCADLNDVYVKTRSAYLGHENMRKILLGTHFLSGENYHTHFVKAAKIRAMVTQEITHAFTKCDFLCTPTMPAFAPKLQETGDKAPFAEEMLNKFLSPFNLSGNPALSMPMKHMGGHNEKSNTLPMGVQLVAAPFKEVALLQCAYTLEQSK